ncbi:hypothetical protein [Methanobrevibacter sp.]|uniref:hypothetical protein n=1 Tax=Methanobrevibacter sp. TaxID=66852 RepID=UPI0025F49891|nr:hypothetical protein [Methanobrevibacter sp.]MBQ2665749.1 hypothetical protein [Methanobrevibacter sp.]
MTRKLSFILLISLVFIISISAISATDENNDTLSTCEYDASADLNTDDLSTTDSEESYPDDSDNQTLSSYENSERTDTQISANNTNIVKTDYFKVTLTDAEGNALSNQSVIFNLADANHTQTTDDDGVASLKIDLAPDSYDVTVYYPGDSTYGQSEANYTIVCYQIASKIVVQSTSVVRGNYFTAYLYDASNNPVAGQTLSFKINGNTYTRTTNSKGAASLKISQNVGKYSMTISHAGGAYESASKTVTITSYRLATEIVPVSKRIVKGNYFTVTLKDSTGKALSGQKVIFKISSKTYTRTTNSNGQAKIKINLNSGKYYTVKTTYKGTIPYKASAKTVKIYVKAKKVYGQLLVKGKSITKSGKTYRVTASNKNTVLVKSGAKLTLKNSKIIKTGSVSSSNAESSDFYGTNAAVLVTAKSTLKISDTTITTNAKGANAIFVSNLDSSSSGATAYVSNVVINTYKDKSRGLDATYGGKIIANNVKIYTRGGSCAALATDRGEGTVIANNCKLYTGVGKTSGQGSPLIYSTGDITVSKSSGTSYVSQIACIEGKNSITLTDCDFTGYGKGNRYVNGNYVDNAGIFLYQSMSGDADVGVAKFTATNTKLAISSSSSYYKSAPMFYVTNTGANINLNSCTLSYGSGVLLKAAGQSQWGKTGSNGGDVAFTATNMSMSGKIIIDKISSMKLTLSKTKYSGCINPSSSYGTTKLVINSGSTWTLTGNSHISSLSNYGTINYGSYTLYVNGKAYTASNPYTG